MTMYNMPYQAVRRYNVRSAIYDDHQIADAVPYAAYEHSAPVLINRPPSSLSIVPLRPPPPPLPQRRRPTRNETDDWASAAICSSCCRAVMLAIPSFSWRACCNNFRQLKKVSRNFRETLFWRNFSAKSFGEKFTTEIRSVARLVRSTRKTFINATVYSPILTYLSCCIPTAVL